MLTFLGCCYTIKANHLMMITLSKLVNSHFLCNQLKLVTKNLFFLSLVQHFIVMQHSYILISDNFLPLFKGVDKVCGFCQYILRHLFSTLAKYKKKANPLGKMSAILQKKKESEQAVTLNTTAEYVYTELITISKRIIVRNRLSGKRSGVNSVKKNLLAKKI